MLQETKTRGTSKIARLCALLREDIISGRISPGSPLPSQKQLGRKFGVAEGTISAAMGRLVHEGLAMRIPGRGSFVVENLPTAHRTLDFVRMQIPTGGVARGWVLSWMEALNQLCDRDGWVARWHHLPGAAEDRLQALAEKLADSKGVILFAYVPFELPVLMHRHGISVVSLRSSRGGMGERPDYYPQITFDRRESARIATEHLVSLGYRRIGFMGSTDRSQQRMAGFLDVMRSHRLPVEIQWLQQFDWQVSDLHGLHIGIRQIMQEPDWPEAFCCATKDIATAVAAVARDLGKEVPQDLALVACDEGEPDVPGHLAITTVSVAKEECWQKAQEVLEQLRSESGSNGLRLWEPIMMPLHLTLGESCGTGMMSENNVSPYAEKGG